jgi:DNA repair protein RadA/Sms
MSRTRVAYRCEECAAAQPKWAGQCATCGAWNSLVEHDPEVSAPPVCRLGGAPATPIGEVDAGEGAPRPTGVGELDRVLGGGLVPGSVSLLGGEPGIGKSTLLLQLAARWSGPALYVTAEESAQQVRTRAARLVAIRPDLWLMAESSLPDVIATLDTVAPSLLIVDSIQTVGEPAVGSVPGSPSQVRACAQRLVVEAKRRQLPVVIAGHVTKDNALAGPRLLEHVVDTVLAFEGDRHHALRLLRATKHRFGPVGELGVFEMGEDGLRGVPEASRLFLSDRHRGASGSVVLPTLEGSRPLLVEVQALTNPVGAGVTPRRNAQGLDAGRMAMLLAVLERRAGLRLAAHEVFASAVGGVRVDDPGADAAVCLAVVSALADLPVPDDLVVFGEVGLAGELRQASHATRRLAEAARLGFRRAIVPRNTPVADVGIEVHRVSTIIETVVAVCPPGALASS